MNPRDNNIIVVVVVHEVPPRDVVRDGAPSGLFEGTAAMMRRSLLDVLGALTALQNARLDLERSRYEAAFDRAALEAVCGGPGGR